jgi:hypothetical protein
MSDVRYVTGVYVVGGKDGNVVLVDWDEISHMSFAQGGAAWMTLKALGPDKPVELRDPEFNTSIGSALISVGNLLNGKKKADGATP